MSRGQTPRKVTTEQLQELDKDERDTVLFYLKGYLSKSDEFQEGLARGYDLVMRYRAEDAVAEAARDPEGLALVKAIHDRKAGRGRG